MVEPNDIIFLCSKNHKGLLVYTIMDYKRENLWNTNFADFLPAFSYFHKKGGFWSFYKCLIKQFEQTIATYTQQTFIS